jgi:uroporphyrinogen-III decarboxylase
MERVRQGRRPVFNLAPFIPMTLLRQKGLGFNRVLRMAEDMAEAALLSFEVGFESTTLPFDLNVEGELLGGPIHYHDEVEGHPVYPTMGLRRVETPDDLVIPEDLASKGRLPEITRAIRLVKEHPTCRGAVGVFIPGPFTLAGQVMDPDKLFLMVLKHPEALGRILDCLTELIVRLRDLYAAAGAEYVTIEEGGATTISPLSFNSLVLPRLKKIFEFKTIPQALSLTGRSDKYLELILECRPNAIGVDQECRLEAVLDRLPPDLPLFAVCGAYDLLATTKPDDIRRAVRACLNKGVRFPIPPADICPPGKPENIAAFVDEVRNGAA